MPPTTQREPMQLTKVSDGLWEATWEGSEWVISQRIQRRKRGLVVYRDRKQVAFVSTLVLAVKEIQTIVGKEQN